MGDFEKIGKAFIDHYYATFDQNRQNLAPLYGENSLLTWENEKIQKRENILKKLAELPFASVKHDAQTIDCQPSVSGGVIIFVGGSVRIDDGPPMRFCDVFHLASGGNNSFFLTNHMFRLQLG